MRKRVLLVAAEMDVRARFAGGLQSAGYAVELASSEERALKLAANDKFQLAIVAPERSSAGLTTVQLAGRAGLHRKTVQLAERGRAVMAEPPTSCCGCWGRRSSSGATGW